MSKVNRFSLEERYGYQNRKVIYDKDADNDIELNNIYPIIDLLNKNNEQIAELQKQLEEKTKTIEGLIEEQKNIENSASYQMFLDCQNTIENYRKATKELRKEYDERVGEIKQARLLNDRLGERIKGLENQLHSQPVEIVENIKRTVVPVARLTKNNEMRIELNSFFRVLDTILKEYQKQEKTYE